MTAPVSQHLPHDIVSQQARQLVALFNAGHYVELESRTRVLLGQYPAHGFLWKVLGACLKGQGKEALPALRKATELLPNDAEAHSNLSNALQDCGQLDAAVANCRRALQIKPNYAEAHYNLGNALKLLGQFDGAIANYRRALEIKPDLTEAHYNLGNTLQDLGQLDAAAASYRQALVIRPDLVGALNELALLHIAQGGANSALDIIKQSLQIEETGAAKSVFVACVKRLRFTNGDNNMRVAMVRALTEPWGRPIELMPISIYLVKLAPDIGQCVARASIAWPQSLSAHDLYGSNGFSALAAEPLLCALLDSAPICDIEMERFLTMARRVLLEVASSMTASPGELGATLRFYSALARQCFINEYVFSCTDDEIQKAGDLRDSLAAALQAKTQVSGLGLVAVAAYFPLNSIPLAARLLDRPWPEAVTAVLVQQVSEPAQEVKLRATIPRLSSIEDEVSLQVQNQYEENPYPRWIKTAPAGRAKNIGIYLCEKFPLAAFKSHAKCDSIDILVAGCGTGQHPISTVQRIQGARVLAVDLSMSSLGYAKRKTRELGLTTIEYAQADLLKLGSLGRSFDVIESSGVLHHLADPWAGWRVLLSLLRPGGLMKLGFYSELARRDIVRIRTFISEQGYASTATDIRRCRQDLMDSEKSADFGPVTNFTDFFSMSTCRDLLFHVQEHRMTLTGIAAFLRANNLTFLGFECEGDVLHSYRRRFPDDRASVNLAQWQIFENENPDTFFGMYQFWVQKGESKNE